MPKKLHIDKEKLQAWITEVDGAEDEADTFVYYDKPKKRVYDDGYMAWNTEYTYPERSNGGWFVACMQDGEVFWDNQRSEAMGKCERHIINGHVTKKAVPYVWPKDPPF